MRKFKIPIGCWALFLFLSASFDCWALQKIDQLTGIDQSYKAGYTLQSRSEEFHDASIQEFVVEQEAEEEAEYEEEEAERFEEDLWQYTRAFEFGTIYQKNPKGLAHDPRNDLTYTFKPTVGMSRKSGHTSVSLGYGLVHTRMSADEEASTVSHAFSTEVGYQLDGIRLTISNGFSPKSILARGERTELSTDNAAQDSVFAFSNAFKTQLAYPMTLKTSVSFAYDNSITYFPTRAGSVTTNESLSDMTHSYNPRLTYQVSQKVSVFGDYKREIRDFFKGGDFSSRSHTIQAGFESPSFFKTKLKASGGYFIRDFQLLGLPSAIGCVYTVGIARSLTPKITASLFSSQEIGENLDARTSARPKTVTTLFGYNLTYALSPHLSLQNNATAGFLEKTGSVTKVDPENPTRTLTRPNLSETYIWGLGLGWSPRKYFSAFAGYDYTNQKAPFNSSESKNHRFAVSGSINF